MFIVAVLTPKGGTGKTFAATQIATRAMDDFERVAVIDLDPTAGLRTWHAARQNTEMGEQPTLHVGVASLPDALDACKRDDVGCVVIDGAPNSIDAIVETVAVSDIVVIPERCSTNDVHSAAIVARVCHDADTPAIGLINDVPLPSDKKPFQVAQADAIEASITTHGIAVARTHNRDAYLKCRELGIGIVELAGNVSAAQREIEALYAMIMETRNA